MQLADNLIKTKEFLVEVSGILVACRTHSSKIKN
jgi:hypothetical protein